MRSKNLGAATAYAIAKKNGFVGTEQEWLDSLKAPKTVVQTVEQSLTDTEKMQARKNLGLPYEIAVDVLPATEFALTPVAEAGVSVYAHGGSPSARPFGEIEIGQKYKVTINGESWECVAQHYEWEDPTVETSYSEGWALGNAGEWTISGVGLGSGTEPFALVTFTGGKADATWGSWMTIQGEMTSANVAIEKIELTSLPEKFLPDDIGSGGPVKWSDIPDKPFTTVGGDTLTWDGNTEGLVSVADILYKVSDAVITETDLVNGYTVIFEGEEIDIAAEDVAVLMPGLIGNECAFFVSEDAVGVEVGGAIFSETGVYFLSVEGNTSSLTIPGYTGFTKEVINEDVLPDSAKVQPDWNQTDATAADFVKNKPFGEMQIPILSGEIAMEYVDGMCGYELAMPQKNGLDIEHIRVKWGDTVYECERKLEADYGSYYFGNAGVFGLADTGEPFFIQCAQEVWLICDGVSTESYNINVDISHIGVVRLPDKYSPLPIVFKYNTGDKTDSYLYRPGVNSYTEENRVTKQELSDYIALGKPMWVVNRLVVAWYDMSDYGYVQVGISSNYYTAEYTAS